MKKIAIYTDGACRGNPGPGGYAAVIKGGDKLKKISAAEKNTTNNRMEMMAAVAALRDIKEPAEIKLVSDSTYLVKGMGSWIHGWMKKGWKTASGSPVKNKDLWEELLKLAKPHKIKWEWIKGHDGHPENELCDLLANEAIDKILGK